MMDLKLKKIVGLFSVFIFFVFLFVGLAQAASAPTIITVGGTPFGLAVTPDGKYVYVPNGEDVAVINTASSKVTARVAVGGWPSCDLAASPNGEYVYVLNRGVNGNGFVSVISVATNKVTSTVWLGSNPMGVTVSPDGKYLYVLTSELLEVDELHHVEVDGIYYDIPMQEAFGIVSVISTATNSVLTNMTVGRFALGGVAVSPDGKYLYVPGNGALYVVDPSLKTETVSIKIAEDTIQLWDVAVSSDGKYVYVSGGKEVFVVSTKSKSVVATVSGLSSPMGLALSSDGRYVYVAGTGSSRVSAINTATNVVDFTVDAGTSSNWVVVSSDGAWLYVSNYDGGIVSAINIAPIAATEVGLSVVQWLIVVGVCVIVVAVVIAFLLVRRVKRKSKLSVLKPSAVNNNVLIKPIVFSCFCLV